MSNFNDLIDLILHIYREKTTERFEGTLQS